MDVPSVSMAIKSWLRGVLVSVCLIPAVVDGQEPSTGSASRSPKDVVIAQIQAHYDALGGLGATCHRRFTRIGKLTPLDSLPYMEGDYPRRHAYWARSGTRSHMVERNPEGKVDAAVLYDGGIVERYSRATGSVNRMSGYLWEGDFYPEIYYLALPPLPYLPFLEQAEVIESTDDQAVLWLKHPLAEGQALRIHVSRLPKVRVNAVELCLVQAVQNRVLETFRFDDWVEVRGQPFPLLATKDLHDLDGGIRASQELRLQNLSEAEPPTVLRVPSGTTYFDNLGDQRPIVLGSLRLEALRRMVDDLVSTAATSRPPARIFLRRDGHVAGPREVAETEPELVDAKPQSTAALCGLYCAQCALLLWRPEITVLPEVVGSSDEWLDLQTVQQRLRKRGVPAESIQVSMAQLLELEKPALLPVRLHEKDGRPSHVVLLCGASDGKPLLLDPPHGTFVGSPDWLAKHWRGDALVLGLEVPLGMSRWWLLLAPVVIFAWAAWFRGKRGRA